MNMKYIVGLIVLSLSASVNADIANAGLQVFKSARVYGKDTKIGFELWNKGRPSDTIWYALLNGDAILTTNKSSSVEGIKPGALGYKKLDITKDTALALWMTDPGSALVKIDKNKPGGITWTAATDPYFIYTFPKGRTLYLTWAPTSEGPYALRPQTGPLKGLSGKTDSGLSINEPGNVKSEDIKIVFEKAFKSKYDTAKQAKA